MKTPQRRRHELRPPLICYCVICLVLCLAVLVTGGFPLIIWTLGFIPLIIAAVILTRSRKERSVSSGLVTVAAACLMFFVLRCGGWPLLNPGTDAVIGLGLYGYFAGTVFHVKALIRERANRAAGMHSVIWHLAWLVLMLVAVVTGLAWWAWPVFFAVLAARTWVMTRMSYAGRRFSPAIIGVTECLFSLVALWCALG